MQDGGELTAPVTPPASRGRLGRRLATVAAALIVVAVGVFALLHLPAARGWALRQGAALLRDQAGVLLDASRLDYRLGSLSFDLYDLRLAAVDTPDEPFFSAGHLHANATWRLLLGRLDFDRVHLRAPTVDVRLHADGTDNLPGPTDGDDRPIDLPWFVVGELTLSEFSTAIGGDRPPDAITLRGVTLEASGSEPRSLDGHVVATGGLEIAFDHLGIAIDRIESTFAFDGRRVTVTPLVATSDAGPVRIEGTLTIFGPDTGYDLRAAGNLDAAVVSRWIPDAPRVTGTIAARTHLTGPISHPEMALELDGRDVAWQNLAASSLRASGRVSGEGLTIEQIGGEGLGGSLTGSGYLAFDRAGPQSWVDAQWNRIDVNAIVTALAGRVDGLPPVASSGSGKLTWQGSSPVPHELEGSLKGSLVGARGRQLGRGVIDASGRAGAWRLSARHDLNAETTATASVAIAVGQTSFQQSRLSGELRVDAARLGPAIDQLRTAGIPIPDFGVVDLAGPLELQATLGGTLSRPRATGLAEAREIAVGTLTGLQATATASIDAGTLTFEPLLVEGRGSRAEARGSLSLDGKGGSGTLSVVVNDLFAVTSDVPERWRPAGVATAVGTWSGGVTSPRIDIDVSSSSIEVVGTRFDRALGNLVVADDTAYFEHLALEQSATGRLQLEGHVSLDGTALAVDASGDGLHLGPLDLTDTDDDDGQTIELGGVLIEGRIRGSTAEPSGSVSVGAANLRWAGQEVGRANAHVDLSGGNAEVTLELPALDASGRGTVSLSEPYSYDARFEFDDTSIGPMLDIAQVTGTATDEVTGTFRATVEASGTLGEIADSRLLLHASDVTARAFGFDVELARPTRIEIDSTRMVLDPVELAFGGFRFRAEGRMSADRRDEAVKVTIDGPVEALAPAIARLDPGHQWTARGVLQGHVEMRGSPRQPDVTGALRGNLRLASHGDFLVGRDLSLDVSLDNDRIELRQFAGTVLGGRMTASGSAPASWLGSWIGGAARAGAGAPAPTASLTARAEIDVASLAAQFERAVALGAKGTVVVNLDASATRPAIEAVTADLVAERGEVQLGELQLTQKEPTRLVLREGRLSVEACEWASGPSELLASGYLGLKEGSDTDLRLRANGLLRLIDLLVPGRASGRGRVSVRLVGPRQARRLTAAVTLDDASLLLPDTRFSVVGVSGALTLSEAGLVVRDLSGQINGGDVKISGRLPFGRDARTTDPLRATARGVFLEVPKGLRSQVDADLTWQATGQATTLGGSITITSGSYREPVTSMLELVDALSAATGGGDEESLLPAGFTSTKLDVAVNATDPVVIDNSLGRVELFPNMRLAGTLGAPALAGRIDALDDGRLSLSGRVYRLRESTLRFSPSEGLVPTLNVIGETRVGEYDITLRIVGTPSAIETVFSSDPPLSERDLRSLLITGRTESAAAAGGGNEAFAMAAVSGDILGFAGKFVGLDSVRFGAADLELVSSDVNPTQRLTVSESLGDRFEVIVSENLEENTLTWVLVYRPRRNFELRLASRDNTDQSIEFRQEITFGPGARPAARSASNGRGVRAQTARVESVTFGGQPGFPPSDLIGQLSLKAGERFDFRKWLSDRKRLERFYKERGYFAARIVPRRSDLEAAAGTRRVTLEYTIQRGPATVLDIEGVQLPEGVVDQMRSAWTATALPEFALDDFERIARGHLADEGYVQAHVTAVVAETDPGRLRVVVTIEPGPRATQRALEFSGNEALGTAELSKLVMSRDLDRVAWRDPAALVREVELLYASRGFLKASVRAGTPAFDNGRATLPVRIIEGPRAEVTSVDVSGVSTERGGDVQKALGLSVGDSYARRGEQAARARLETFYRDLGFRDVAVTAAARVSRDGSSVDVDIEVVEGPRHVVSNVVVSGVESTNVSIVERAVTLKPGSVATPASVAQTRRNLYEVGVFRSADVSLEPAAQPADASTSAPTDTVPVNAVVAVEEVRRFQFRYGLELSNEYGPAFEESAASVGVSADLRDRNFLGRGLSAGIGARYEPSLKSVRSLFAAPRMGSRPIRTNLYLSYLRERDATTAFEVEDERADATLEQRWRPRSTLELSWAYTYSWRAIDFIEITPLRTIAQLGGILAGLQGSAVFDVRDSPFDATRGWLHSSSVQWGLQPLGSDAGFVRYLARQFQYVPIGPVTLAGALRWGSIWETGGDVPPTALDLLFKAGGSTTVRGYAEESLSAGTILGVPVGGTDLLILNGEVRFPIFKWFKGVAFIDAGNTFLRREDVSLDDLAVGVGFGLRIATPLAPLRLDIGYPTTRRPGDKRYRFHFSIGQMF